jgi:hypothetical protein
MSRLLEVPQDTLVHPQKGNVSIFGWLTNRRVFSVSRPNFVQGSPILKFSPGLDNPVFRLRKTEIILYPVGEREIPDSFRPIQDYLDFPCGYLQSSSSQLALEVELFSAAIVNIFILFGRNNSLDILGGEAVT